MKAFKTSSAFILDTLTLFSLSNANEDGFSSHTEKKAEIECLSNYKNCIDAKEKELLYEVEA